MQCLLFLCYSFLYVLILLSEGCVSVMWLRCVCVGVHAPVLVQEADVLSWVKMIQEEMLVQPIFFLCVDTICIFSDQYLQKMPQLFSETMQRNQKKVSVIRWGEHAFILQNNPAAVLSFHH